MEEVFYEYIRYLEMEEDRRVRTYGDQYIKIS